MQQKHQHGWLLRGPVSTASGGISGAYTLRKGGNAAHGRTYHLHFTLPTRWASQRGGPPRVTSTYRYFTMTSLASRAWAIQSAVAKASPTQPMNTSVNHTDTIQSPDAAASDIYTLQWPSEAAAERLHHFTWHSGRQAAANDIPARTEACTMLDCNS